MAYVNYTHTYYQMQALPRFFSTAAVLQICAQLLDCRSINLLASVTYVCHTSATLKILHWDTFGKFFWGGMVWDC